MSTNAPTTFTSIFTRVCLYGVDPNSNLSFPETQIANTAASLEKCENQDGVPKGTRYCDRDSVWGFVVLRSCSQNTSTILGIIDLAVPEKAVQELDSVTKISNLSDANVAKSIDKLDQLEEQLNETIDTSTTDAILSVTQNLYEQLKSKPDVSSKLEKLSQLRNLTNKMLLKQNTSDGETYSVKKDSFSAKVVSVPQNKSEGYKFGLTQSDKDLLPDNAKDISISIPPAILSAAGTGADSKIVIVVYKDDSAIVSKSGSQTKGVVISITVGDQSGPAESTSINSETIDIDFDIGYIENFHPSCVYFDYDKSDWSTTGGSTVFKNGKVTCIWKHATEFAVINSSSDATTTTFPEAYNTTDSSTILSETSTYALTTNGPKSSIAAGTHISTTVATEEKSAATVSTTLSSGSSIDSSTIETVTNLFLSSSASHITHSIASSTVEASDSNTTPVSTSTPELAASTTVDFSASTTTTTSIEPSATETSATKSSVPSNVASTFDSSSISSRPTVDSSSAYSKSSSTLINDFSTLYTSTMSSTVASSIKPTSTASVVPSTAHSTAPSTAPITVASTSNQHGTESATTKKSSGSSSTESATGTATMTSASVSTTNKSNFETSEIPTTLSTTSVITVEATTGADIRGGPNINSTTTKEATVESSSTSSSSAFTSEQTSASPIFSTTSDVSKTTHSTKPSFEPATAAEQSTTQLGYFSTMHSTTSSSAGKDSTVTSTTLHSTASSIDQTTPDSEIAGTVSTTVAQTALSTLELSTDTVATSSATLNSLETSTKANDSKITTKSTSLSTPRNTTVLSTTGRDSTGGPESESTSANAATMQYSTTAASELVTTKTTLSGTSSVAFTDTHFMPTLSPELDTPAVSTTEISTKSPTTTTQYMVTPTVVTTAQSTAAFTTEDLSYTTSLTTAKATTSSRVVSDFDTTTNAMTTDNSTDAGLAASTTGISLSSTSDSASLSSNSVSSGFVTTTVTDLTTESASIPQTTTSLSTDKSITSSTSHFTTTIPAEPATTVTTSTSSFIRVCSYVVDDVSNFSFPETKISDTASSLEICENQDGRPKGTRYCARDSVWGVVVHRSCNKNNSVILDAIDPTVPEKAVQELNSVTKSSNLSDENVAKSLDKLSMLEEQFNETVDISTTDTFLSVTQNIFKQLKQKQNFSSKLEKLNQLRNLTNRVLLKQNTSYGEIYSVKKDSFSAKVIAVPSNISGSFTFGLTQSDRELLPDNAQNISIAIPQALLEAAGGGTDPKIVIIVYEDNSIFKSESGSQAQSAVISITVGDSTGPTDSTNLNSETIDIEFEIINKNFNPTCVFYDYLKNDWSTTGGTTMFNNEKVTCVWSHATEFAVINSSLEATTTSYTATSTSVSEIPTFSINSATSTTSETATTVSVAPTNTTVAANVSSTTATRSVETSAPTTIARTGASTTEPVTTTTSLYSTSPELGTTSTTVSTAAVGQSTQKEANTPLSTVSSTSEVSSTTSVAATSTSSDSFSTAHSTTTSVNTEKNNNGSTTETATTEPITMTTKPSSTVSLTTSSTTTTGSSTTSTVSSSTSDYTTAATSSTATASTTGSSSAVFFSTADSAITSNAPITVASTIELSSFSTGDSTTKSTVPTPEATTTGPSSTLSYSSSIAGSTLTSLVPSTDASTNKPSSTSSVSPSTAESTITSTAPSTATSKIETTSTPFAVSSTEDSTITSSSNTVNLTSPAPIESTTGSYSTSSLSSSTADSATTSTAKTTIASTTGLSSLASFSTADSATASTAPITVSSTTGSTSSADSTTKSTASTPTATTIRSSSTPSYTSSTADSTATSASPVTTVSTIGSSIFTSNADLTRTSTASAIATTSATGPSSTLSASSSNALYTTTAPDTTASTVGSSSASSVSHSTTGSTTTSETPVTTVPTTGSSSTLSVFSNTTDSTTSSNAPTTVVRTTGSSVTLSASASTENSTTTTTATRTTGTSSTSASTTGSSSTPSVFSSAADSTTSSIAPTIVRTTGSVNSTVSASTANSTTTTTTVAPTTASSATLPTSASTTLSPSTSQVFSSTADSTTSSTASTTVVRTTGSSVTSSVIASTANSTKMTPATPTTASFETLSTFSNTVAVTTTSTAPDTTASTTKQPTETTVAFSTADATISTASSTSKSTTKLFVTSNVTTNSSIQKCLAETLTVTTSTGVETILFETVSHAQYISESVQTCSNDASRPRAVRYCEKDGIWSAVYVQSCLLNNTEILASLEITTSSVKNDLAAIHVVTRRTELSGKESASLETVLSRVSAVLTKNISDSITDLFLDTADNAINRQINIQDEATKNASLEALGTLVSEFLIKKSIQSGGSYVVDKTNFYVSVRGIPSNTTNGLTLPFSDISIHVPKQALDLQGSGGDSKVAFVVFRTPNTFFTQNGKAPIGSIITLQIGDSNGAVNVTNLENPITINWGFKTFTSESRSLYNQPTRKFDLNPTCVYYDHNLNSWLNDGGTFSTDSESDVNCAWNHATSFAVQLDSKFEFYKPHSIVTVGSAIAMILMFGVLFVYIFFWRLRKDPIDAITLNLAVMLFLAFLTYVCSSAMWGTLQRPSCLALSSMHHFFLLSAFVWMATMAFVADRCMFNPKKWVLWIALADEPLSNKMIMKFCLVTYGVSVFIFVISMTITIGMFEGDTKLVNEFTVVNLNAYSEVNHCVVKDWGLFFGLGLPAGLTLLMSLIVSIRIANALKFNYARTKNTFYGYQTHYQIACELAERAFIIPVLMTILWSVQFFRVSMNDFAEDTYNVLDIVFGVLCIVIGIAIVLLLLLRPKHVREILRKLASRNCCGSHGLYYLDHESHQPNFKHVPGPVPDPLNTVDLSHGISMTVSEDPRPSFSRIGIREDLPDGGAGVNVHRWRASDAVAQSDYVLTGGKLGLKGFKQYNDVVLTTFSSPEKTEKGPIELLEEEENMISVLDSDSDNSGSAEPVSKVVFERAETSFSTFAQIDKGKLSGNDNESPPLKKEKSEIERGAHSSTKKSRKSKRKSSAKAATGPISPSKKSITKDRSLREKINVENVDSHPSEEKAYLD